MLDRHHGKYMEVHQSAVYYKGRVATIGKNGKLVACYHKMIIIRL